MAENGPSSSSISKHNCARSSLDALLVLPGALDVYILAMYVSRCTSNHVSRRKREYTVVRARAPEQEQTNRSRIFQPVQNEATVSPRFVFSPYVSRICSFACTRTFTYLCTHVLLHAFLISREAYRRLIYRSPASYFQADRGRNSSRV